MKKRLLITSIVMMLVVAVALSTATYAWFTSNASVTANSISMTAATNTLDALGIGWGEGSTGTAGTQITSNVAGVLAPMAPKSLSTTGTITTTDSIQWNSATVKTVGGKLVFNALNETPTPLTFKDGNGSGTNSTFFVKNLSPANSVAHVYIVPTISSDPELIAVAENEKAQIGFNYYSGATADAAELLTDQPELGDDLDTAGATFKARKDASSLVRIAVFKKVESAYQLQCVFASTAANTVMGTIAANSYVDTTETSADNANGIAATPMSNFSAIAAAGGFDLGGLAAGEYHDLAIVAWLDGALFTDAYQNYKANISFTFSTTLA